MQTEIFLQYSLQTKAIDRLQKIAAMFPGEEERNPRLQGLYQMANWWPKAQSKPEAPSKAPVVPVVEAQPTPPTGRTGTYTADTLRDLTKISEINQKTFRQQTPRAMLNTTVTEVGTYMKAARTLAVIGAPGTSAGDGRGILRFRIEASARLAGCVIACANGKGRAG